jgi:hypothetical protein
MDREELIQHGGNPCARERRAHLNRQRLPIALVEDVQRAEAATVVEHVVHEVEGPGVNQDRRRFHRHQTARGEALLPTAREMQAQRPIHAMDALPVPRVPIEPQAITALPKAPPRVVGRHGDQRRDHGLVPIHRIWRRTAVGRPRAVDEAARVHDGQSVLGD